MQRLSNDCRSNRSQLDVRMNSDDKYVEWDCCGGF